MQEKRVDPADGRAYTFEQISRYYQSSYSQQAIQSYWENGCKPVKKAKAKDKVHQFEIRFSPTWLDDLNERRQYIERRSIPIEQQWVAITDKAGVPLHLTQDTMPMPEQFPLRVKVTQLSTSTPGPDKCAKVSVVKAISGEPIDVDLSGVRQAGEVRHRVTAALGLLNGRVKIANAAGELLDDRTPLSDGVITAVDQGKVPLTGKIWLQLEDAHLGRLGMHSEEAHLGDIVSRTLAPNGAFRLKATAVPRAQMSFESFTEKEIPKPYLSETSAEVSGRPADVLWTFLNVAGHQGRASALAPSGFISLAGVPLAPEATAADLEFAIDAFRGQCRTVSPREPLPRVLAQFRAHETSAEGTGFETLKAMLERRGSLGEAFLPDALEPILDFRGFTVGRGSDVFIFSTVRYFFKVEFAAQ